MYIKVRNVDKYKEVIVEIDNNKIDLGLHNNNDCRQLAEELMRAALELIEGIK